jgi:hypothetical protein
MRSTLLISLALTLFVADAQALEAPGRDRGWALGLGFGMGRAYVDYLGGDISDKLREGANTEWRVGKMLGRNLLLSFDYQGWLLEDGDLNQLSARVRQGLQIWGPSLAWYPGNPETAWGGLVIRGAAGAALANLAITVLDEDLIEFEEARLDEWGWGTSLSVGYEFFITETFAAGPMFNVGHLQIDEELMDRATWVTMSIHGTWYFF